MQRDVQRRRDRYLRYSNSLLLDLISVYGYRPARSLIACIIIILGFVTTYLTLGAFNGQPLLWNEAIVTSLTAFHGRGFFSAVYLQAAVAAIEAFIGLLIAIVLIATCTRRFFAR
jgi:hypothetical protein